MPDSRPTSGAPHPEAPAEAIRPAIALNVPLLADIALIAAIVISLAVTLWWLVAIARMWHTRRVLGVCSDGLALPDDPRRVAVFVPAHNEQAVIAALVDSLKAQDHPACRFILALDRCTDATRSVATERIAGDPRFVVHEIASCPEGWAGKVHALHDAVQRHAQDADLLLFADADTTLHPSCIRAASALVAARGLGMLSLLSTLTFDQSFERSMQAPAVFELMRRYPPVLASRDRDRRPFANGQFMLWTHDAYRLVGGHAAFRSELLEDIAMARAAWRAGLRVQVLPAGAMLSCRMYPDEPAFRRGWQRIFTESANRKTRRLESWALAAVVRGTVVPLVLLATLICGVVLALSDQPRAWAASGAAAIAIVAWAAGVWMFLANASVPSRRRIVAVLYWPLGSVAIGHVLRTAARALRSGQATTWGGRSYDRPAR